jgi:hypothetical protein
MHEKTKDIEVDGQKYQLTRLPALTANWILHRLSKSDEEEFNKIQRYLLKSCSLLTEKGPIPIMMADGRWAIASLEFNLKAVAEITNEAMGFNLDDFFDAGASNGRSSPLTSSPPNVPK